MRRSLLTNISSNAIDLLCVGLFFCFIGLGIRLATGSNIALRTATMQLKVSDSSRELKDVSKQLEDQAEILERKEEAYQELLKIYEASLKGKQGYGRLQTAIEKIEVLPEVENLENTQDKINQIEEEIKQISVE